MKTLTPKAPWTYPLYAALSLAVVTVVVYFPSLHYPFQFDDLGSIVQFFGIRNKTLHDLFFSGSRWISYWLNTIHYSIGEFDPFSYRVGNLIIHISNGLLIFFIVYRVLKITFSQQGLSKVSLPKKTSLKNLLSTSWFNENALYIAFITSLLFLLHPVQTQTVSYVIQGQLEGLAAFCILSMVLSLIFFVTTPSLLGKIFSITALCLFAVLSTGTKEIAIISPVLLFLVDWFFLRHDQTHTQALSKTTKNKKQSTSTQTIPTTWSTICSRWWLYVLVTTIVIGCYLYFLKPAFFVEIFGFHKVIRNNTGNVVTQDPRQMIDPWLYFISEFKAIIHYLCMFIWPFTISVEYDDVLCRSFFALDCLAPLTLLMALTGVTIAILYKHRSSPLAFGMLWFFLCITPRSTFIPSNELIVDYKTYTASFGWLLVLAIMLVFFINTVAYFLHKYIFKNSQLHWFFIIATLLLATMLGYATLQRNTVWSSGLKFWHNIVQNAPQKARVHNNYGVELSHAGRYKEALHHLKKALELDHNYADPYNNISIIFNKLNRHKEAIVFLKKGLRINPHSCEGFNNLCAAYIQKHDYARAKICAHQALKINPHYGKAYGSLARIFLEQDKPEIAWEYLKKACTQADLDTPLGFNSFAQVSIRLKKYDDAIWAFNKLLSLDPHYPEARLSLANAYFLSQHYAQAEEQYKKLLNGSTLDAFMYYNLGKSAFEQKHYDQALTYYKHIPENHPQIKDVPTLIAACLNTQTLVE